MIYFRSQDFAAPTKRLWGLVALSVVVASVLVWRWADLQVQQYGYFAELAHENQIKVLPIEPPRGLIYDRNGATLATNKTVYSLNVESDFAGEVLGKLDTLTTAIALPPQAVRDLRDAVDQQVYKGAIILKDQLSDAEVVQFLNIQFLFPEVLLHADLVRHYPYASAAGHVLGYVGRIADADKQALAQQNKSRAYRGAKFIGKTGVELIYEQRLRGQLGSQEANVDAHGRIVARRVLKQPAPGKDVYLTLDWSLQQLAEDLLTGDSGAAVVIDIHTGALLALASSPRFDSNQFVFGIPQKRWDALNESPSKPLIHRAIYGQYAPGSTIKPFLALAALQHGWRDLDYTYHSRGTFRLTNKHIFHDWKKGGHGIVDIEKSIVRSVNTFYYKLGHDIGIDNMARGLAVFGFGKKTGVDLNGESEGVLPGSEWKQNAKGGRWYPGDTVAAAVGQGYWLVTPLQMAQAMAVLANGGVPIQPHLFVGDTADATTSGEDIFASEYLQTVRAALAKVTQPGGTAWRLSQNNAYGIAGKTGTAQISRLQLDARGERIKNKDLPKHLRDHAWFVGYAPADAPQVAVAVIVEHGGSGGATAAPIVRQLLDHHLTQ